MIAAQAMLFLPITVVLSTIQSPGSHGPLSRGWQHSPLGGWYSSPESRQEEARRSSGRETGLLVMRRETCMVMVESMDNMVDIVKWC